MKTNDPRFDGLVARYYPAVYGYASRLTDDPRYALALTRNAFQSVRGQLLRMRDRRSIANALFSAVIRTGLATA
jgi:DNA-directed RNA polymerase specialized sigma24 family protein